MDHYKQHFAARYIQVPTSCLPSLQLKIIFVHFYIPPSVQIYLLIFLAFHCSSSACIVWATKGVFNAQLAVLAMYH